MTSEMVILLMLSAATWLIIKRAETEPDADGANEPPARATAARVDAVEVRATGLQARGHQDQLVPR